MTNSLRIVNEYHPVFPFHPAASGGTSAYRREGGSVCFSIRCATVEGIFKCSTVNDPAPAGVLFIRPIHKNKKGGTQPTVQRSEHGLIG
jgi:hypothetical protein